MSLRRRNLLASAGTAATLVLAGCSAEGEKLNTPPDDSTRTTTATPTETPPPDPVPNLKITDFQPTIGNGTVTVDVTVDNVGDQTGSGTLAVVVTAGDTTSEKTRSVSVPTGESKTYTVELDVDLEAFREDGSIDFEWSS